MPAAKYNLLVISIDTLRADHLTCYGYDRGTSPHLDQLAREGVLFENLTAASSWTVPSHMSMFTSLYPSVHKVQNFSIRLAEGIPTLAQCLAQSGYVTAAFVTGPALNHYFGFNRGFQTYDDFTVSKMFENRAGQEIGFLEGIDHAVTNPAITDLATQWLRKHSQERFFLFLHYWDCHYDYIPPAPFNRKFDPGYPGREDGRDIRERDAQSRGAYLRHGPGAHGGSLRRGNRAHGRAGRQSPSTCSDLRLSEKTLVIILSDHGEAFLEHGKLIHGNSLYEECFMCRSSCACPESSRPASGGRKRQPR